ncbi:N5-carboxyaminoimidazole ribonucleotide mutase [uncultured archaeon]|nr:N5-carboxyaminoimidazole ribonucleotide mutase [uncultured archaeon]
MMLSKLQQLSHFIHIFMAYSIAIFRFPFVIPNRLATNFLNAFPTLHQALQRSFRMTNPLFFARQSPGVKDSLRELLEQHARGEISLDKALGQIRLLSCRALGDMAKLDTQRANRIGVPEAILAEGKDKDDLAVIALAHLEEAGSVIITRVSPEQLQVLKEANLPPGSVLDHNSRAKTVVLRAGESKQGRGKVGILAAGTADIPVAEEAKVVAQEMGCTAVSEYDVGVAGIHRLFPCLEKMIDVDAMVVAAGREGTLPAVVAGILDAPVIGLPVSTGYGVGGNGIAALMSMLQSCSVLTVVNIDAGFVAGAYAAKIAMLRINH